MYFWTNNCSLVKHKRLLKINLTDLKHIRQIIKFYVHLFNTVWLKGCLDILSWAACLPNVSDGFICTTRNTLTDKLTDEFFWFIAKVVYLVVIEWNAGGNYASQPSQTPFNSLTKAFLPILIYFLLRQEVGAGPAKLLPLKMNSSANRKLSLGIMDHLLGLVRDMVVERGNGMFCPRQTVHFKCAIC